MSEHSAYPLDWPPGWPRATRRVPSKFSGRHRRYEFPTIAEGRDRLLRELGMMNATYVVLSTNIRPRLDGLPASNTAEPDDPGVSVYFSLKGRPHVLACDKWSRVGCNLAAIAKHIEALRGIDRWGVGSIERAFAGFSALPPPGASTEPAKRPWRVVLDVECPANPDGGAREAFLMLAESRFKAKARTAHPDAGGTTEAMAELNIAIGEAREELSRG